MATQRRFDIERLARMVRQKRANQALRLVCGEIGLSPSTISRLENGKTVDIDGLMLICQWLDVEPGEFFLSTEKLIPAPVKVRLISSSRSALENSIADLEDFYGDRFDAQRVESAREGWRVYANLQPEDTEKP